MKCIRDYVAPKRDGSIVQTRIRRVSDDQAKTLVEGGKAVYVGKQEWKATVRDVQVAP